MFLYSIGYKIGANGQKSVEFMPCLILRVTTPAPSNKSFHAVTTAFFELILEGVSHKRRCGKLSIKNQPQIAIYSTSMCCFYYILCSFSVNHIFGIFLQ